MHVRILLTEAMTPSPNPLVDVLLAPLAPDVYLHQREALGHTPDQVADALTCLAHRLLENGGRGGSDESDSPTGANPVERC